MSKFNRTVTPRVSSPIKTATVATGQTFNGAPGFERDARSELFLLAVQNMVGEKTFYESGKDRDSRFNALIRDVAVTDPDWFARFVRWLRGPDANMRSASLVAAAEGVKARLDANVRGGNRQLISSVLQRADEPGEMLAYWISTYGRAIPQPVKRGVADAAVRLYNEYSTLKYDTPTSGIRFADVIALTHPLPADLRGEWQADLFDWVNARRWGREIEIPWTLKMIHARQLADAMRREDLLSEPELIKDAGYTWENIAGKGKMDAHAWEAVIPQMGVFALLRNLRNFDEAGISSEAQNFVRAKLTDPEVIAKSRLFPFRFLAAYQAVHSENWGRELEQALNLSLSNVPALSGRTLILVDRSASMFYDHAAGALSDMSRADVAALFGVSLALRAEYADVVQFGTNFQKVDVPKGASALKLINQFRNMGGTQTEEAVRGNFRPGFHDRLIVVTDEQATQWHGGRYLAHDAGVYSAVPESVPVHTLNMAGYEHGQAPGGKNRFSYGGLTDTSFRLIPILESGRDGNWDQILGA